MSKDIRSFFKVKPNQIIPKSVADDDEIPESPEVVIPKKKKTKARAILHDSSDEEPSIKKHKSSSKSKEKTPNSKNKKDDKKNFTEVKPSDIFGNTKIKRTEPMVKSEKKKPKTETGIHSDEELEKTLLEMDVEEMLAVSPNNSQILTNVSNHTDKNNKKEERNTSTKIENKDESKNTKKSPKQSINSNKVSTDSKHKVLENKGKSSKEVKEAIKNENKRTFSEFIDEDKVDDKEFKVNKNKEEIKTKKRKLNKSLNESVKVIENNKKAEPELNKHEEEEEMISKKRKHNKSLNESVISDEERYEKKRYSAALYQNYLNRSGPKHLGSKEMPEGAPDCLKDCAFLLTGVLDSFEREVVVDTINKYGGCVKNGISKKVTHVLAGDEAGPAKIAKAQDLNIKIICEDEFLKMLTSSKNKNHKSIKDEKVKSKSSNKSDIKTDKSENKIVIKSEKERQRKKTKSSEDVRKHVKTESVTPKKSKDEIAIKSEKESPEKKLKSIEKIVQKNFYSKTEPTTHKKVETKIEENKSSKEHIVIEKENGKVSNGEQTHTEGNAQMWVEKYKPQNVKQIIGQHGDASNVKKLTNWLSKWYLKRKEKIPKPSPWAKNDDGGYFKAALLSGPPGVGKTTTVSLVCKELGFDTVEFNASDTRSKTLIKEQISDLLTTSSLSAYAKGDTGKQAVTKKHVLVMDEVDGMAGTEDRGGMQELISLIKTTAVPIICMCNDRNSQKMRSLVNYCYDLKFSRPRVDQIKSAMLSICYKEGVRIPPSALAELIVASNQDVRQTLNLLSMWSVNCKQMDSEQVTKDSNMAKKDLKLGPWEAVRKVFSAEEHKTMSINDKSDLFFYDYSIAPLFVQENYLQVTPNCAKEEVLDRVSLAADSISLGDLIDKRIRERNAWSLLPTQAMFSSVIPGHHMSGYVSGQIQFPAWLGKNSSQNKMKRLCQEIHAHTRLTTTGSKSSVYLDYCSHLRDAIITPLIKHKAEGVTSSMEVLQAYNLLREDLDSLTALSLWPGQRDPMVLVDSKVKAAMTRAYNKEAMALPYAPGPIKKARANDVQDEDMTQDDDAAEVLSDSDPEHDVLIVKKKKSSEKKKDSDKPSTSKGAGKKSKSNKKS